MAYIGVSPSNGVRQKHTYTATASQTSFSGAGAEGISLSYLDSNYVDVYQNGVKLSEADYTSTTGTTVVLATGATVSDMIEIIVYDVFSVADTVSKADGGTFDGNVTMAGTLAVTGETTLATHLNMGDGDIIKLGASADLTIQHDGSNSIITDAGTGRLKIQGSRVDINKNDGSEGMAAFIEDAQVILYHNNAVKLQTDATGILVGSSGVNATLSTSSAGTSNLSLGVNAGNSIASGGNYNVLVGDEAGTALTTGDNNVAIGFEALTTEDAHGENTAVGYRALKTLNAGASGLNTAIGYNAALSMTTGVQNVIIGVQAGDALTDADYNVAVGPYALTSDTQGSKSTALGFGTLVTQNFSSATDSFNTAIGYNAGTAVTTGIQNTLVGSLAGDALTDADYNVAVGLGALSIDTKGSKSTAIGYNALNAQNFTSSTNTNNTAVGYQAGVNVTTGTSNSFFGLSSGVSNTSGGANTALGVEAGYANQTGDNTTFIGRSAGIASTADSNTFIGRSSGSQVTSGANNTILGRYQGNSGGLDIRTADDNIVLSDGSGNPRGYYKSSVNRWIFESDSASDLAFSFHNTNATNPYGAIIKTTASADNDGNEYFLACNDSSANRFIVLNNGNVQNTNNSYGAISDVKLKEQITDASSQWEDIKALTVRKYKMKEEVSAKGDSDNLWRLGVVAQEVETAGMNGLISESIDRDEEMNDLGTTTKTVKYSILYMKAVKALQEAMTRIETLEAKVTALEGE